MFCITREQYMGRETAAKQSAPFRDLLGKFSELLRLFSFSKLGAAVSTLNSRAMIGRDAPGLISRGHLLRICIYIIVSALH